MPTKQAVAFATELLAAYPGRSSSTASIKSIAEALDSVGIERADDVCALLRLRCSDPPSVAQVFQTAREVAGDIPLSGEWSTWHCTFSDQVECRQCGEVHGRLLSSDDVSHGLYHLKRYLAGSAEDHEAMRAPWTCACERRTA